jgi:hypothetical protein
VVVIILFALEAGVDCVMAKEVEFFSVNVAGVEEKFEIFAVVAFRNFGVLVGLEIFVVPEEIF